MGVVDVVVVVVVVVARQRVVRENSDVGLVEERRMGDNLILVAIHPHFLGRNLLENRANKFSSPKGFKRQV